MTRGRDLPSYITRRKRDGVLLLAGCDDDLIAAVTGQSRRMVEHYTSHVRQRARAIEAQRRRTE